ncbi:39967_t:CDS:2, partial [Gigaspora margarita]
LPQITPHEAFLYFDKTNNSMSQINSNFRQIEDQALSIRPKNVFIFTDMTLNNNVLYFLYRDINNTEFIDATKPFNPIIRYARNSNVSQNIKRSRYDVDSLVGHGIILGGGPGFASAHSLDIIFDELEKTFDKYLKLYLEDSGGS